MPVMRAMPGGAGLYRPAMHRPPWGLDDPRPADYEIRSRIEDIRADALFRMRGLPDPVRQIDVICAGLQAILPDGETERPLD
jgi:hypothetical protein